MQWLSDPKVQVKWYKQSTDLPVREARLARPGPRSDKKLAEFGKQLETAKAPPSFPTWEQVVASFDTEMEKVTKPGADPAAALKTVQEQAESIGTGQLSHVTATSRDASALATPRAGHPRGRGPPAGGAGGVGPGAAVLPALPRRSPSGRCSSRSS